MSQYNGENATSLIIQKQIDFNRTFGAHCTSTVCILTRQSRVTHAPTQFAILYSVKSKRNRNFRPKFGSGQAETEILSQIRKFRVELIQKKTGSKYAIYNVKIFNSLCNKFNSRIRIFFFKFSEKRNYTLGSFFKSSLLILMGNRI